MSLCLFSDYSTRILIRDLQESQEGLGRGDSLRQVQLEMSKKTQSFPLLLGQFIHPESGANLDGKR